MHKSEDFGSIIKKEKLHFKNQKELENYYNHKWAGEGYKKGYKNFGINISKIYHKARTDTAFKLLNPQKSETILDAGCGDGSWDFRIAKHCKKLIAVDISKPAFENSINNAPKNLIFKKMNVESLNFKNDSFNKIYCVETIENLLKPEIALKEFHRVLKKEGELVISYPLIDTTPVARFFLWTKLSKPQPISEHLTNWGYNEFITNVEKSNFQLKSSRGVVFDLGKIESLKKYSKRLVMPIVSLSLATSLFPRNSLFVVAKFKKIN